MRTKRILAAFLAPWSAPILIVLGAVIDAGGWPFHYELGLIVSISVIAAYLGLLLFGLPTLWALRRIGFENIFTITIAGAFIGAIVFSVFLVLFAFGLGSHIVINNVLSGTSWGMGLGFVVSLTYAIIAGLTRRTILIQRSG